MLCHRVLYHQLKNETLENSNADKAKRNEAFVSTYDILGITYLATYKLRNIKRGTQT